MRGQIRVTILHLAEDDPRKNTAIRLAKHKKARIVDKAQQVPDQAVLLNPFAKKALSREDLPAMRKHGLVAVDCSWRSAEHAFSQLLGRTRSRALPVLWAANPTKWGRPTELSTAEAIGAALFIVGEAFQARDALSALPFGREFFELNAAPLEDYAAAETSADVVVAQARYLDEEE